MEQSVFLEEQRKMRKRLMGLLGGALAVVAIPVLSLGADKVIKMSTTTSTQASGLLDVLLPEFTKDTGIILKVFAKGTGAAIRDGMDGNVDVILVHDKAREEQFVAEGYGTQRYAVMYNDFVILGPPNDPAGIKGMKDAAGSLKRIARAGAKFISRGDDRGTHTKEEALCVATGLPLAATTTFIVKEGKNKELTFKHPKGLGRWYLSVGQGMGKTIAFADEKRGYTLSDRGTYIKYKFGRKETLDLQVLCEGDAMLHNPYGVIPVNPMKYPHVRFELAQQFARWLVSEKGQTLIASYRLHGKQLFYPETILDVE
jgi:tungstate transport system substrate-binding protein